MNNTNNNVQSLKHYLNKLVYYSNVTSYGRLVTALKEQANKGSRAFILSSSEVSSHDALKLEREGGLTVEYFKKNGHKGINEDYYRISW